MGFPRLLSIFYCTFHPVQGPKVLYEVPEGSILSKTSPLVDFDSISEYLIPKVELCSKLVTISTPTCKVVGFPINLEHKKFQRNALMFNLAFVFDKDAETSSYEPVVRKMARVLKALEKESEFLSRQTRLAMLNSAPGGSLMGSINNLSMPPAVSTTPLSTPSASTATLGANTNGLLGPTRPSFLGSAMAEGSSGILETIAESTSSLSINDSSSVTAAQTNPGTKGMLTTSALPSLPNTLAVPEGANMNATPGPTAIPSSASTLPTSDSQSSINITSTALVSSPPSISSSAITAVLQAPPFPSPFSQSKLADNHVNGNGTSASNIQKSSTALASTSLHKEDQIDGGGMQNLIEQLIEDLNSYCECQIPIVFDYADSANTINLKLFPTYPNPPPVYDYQVPISTVNLEALTDVNWDMTMQRITGFINGVNSVKRIAEYADVETGLARMCMQHLLYYGCIIMVDLFQFKNIYAVKLEMMRLTEDVALQHECVSYVTLPDMHAPSFAKIFSLYCSLQYGVVLQDWIEQNQISDYNIDVRRFISFGVIKGFLYRVHKYPILDNHDPATVTASTAKALDAPPSSSGSATAIAVASTIAAPSMTPLVPMATLTNGTNGDTTRPGMPSRSGTPSGQPKKVYGDTLTPADQNGHPHSTHPQQQHSHHQLQDSSNSSSSTFSIPPALQRLLDGEHHYDELCTTFGCSVREMDRILATDSRVKFIYR
ncbi:Nitrogen permease regulator 2 [Mortierella claussenii]|nr:Nitrogen permease regulator 2 [Mortierella claussenii]